MRKFSRIFSNVSVNICRVWTLMRLMTSSNCVLAWTKIVVLFAEELVALLRLFVFLDGDEVDRPHFIQALLQRLDLLRDRGPVRRAARRRHFLRRHDMHFRRAFVGKGDGDAFAADVVKVEMVFLLNAIAQVLHGHVLLRQFDLDGAALLLDFGQAPPLFAQGFLAGGNVSFLRLLLRPAIRRFARSLVRGRAGDVSICARESWISDSACSLRPTNEEHSARRCSNTCASSRNALLQSLLLLPERRAELLLRGEGRLCFPSDHHSPRRASRARSPSSAVSAATWSCRSRSRASSCAGLRRKSGAFLQPFLFLGGEALDFVNDGVDLLMEQPARIFQRGEFTFARGNRDFLARSSVCAC